MAGRLLAPPSAPSRQSALGGAIRRTVLGAAIGAMLVAFGALAQGRAADVAAGRPLPASGDAMWVRFPQARPLSDAAVLGREIFFDRSLSASGRMACATCHDPDHAYGPPNGLAVQLGGAGLDQAGVRAVPSLRYLRFTPKFTRHLAQPSSDGVEDEGPAGGFARDGAAATLHDQALLPLLNPLEMANASVAAIGARLQGTSYAVRFKALYGQKVFDRPAQAVAHAAEALEAFEREDPSFEPYTSKFDSVMSGHAAFTAQERRGYRLFNDPRAGNCAKCHIDVPGPGGRPAQFTDYGFVALGVPRNPELAANRDPRYFDLGLCGPVRNDLAGEAALCGMFKTPTLRNVASRQTFFHNGVFRSLDKVLQFYSERDSAPAKWYPATSAKRRPYDDLPSPYRSNVDHVDEPFTRKPGDKPVFSRRDIDDLVAFLKTLNDGYAREAGGVAAVLP